MNSQEKEPQAADAGGWQDPGIWVHSPSQVQDAAGPLFPFPKSMKIELQLGKLFRDFSVLFRCPNYSFFSLSSRMAGLSLFR